MAMFPSKDDGKETFQMNSLVKSGPLRMVGKHVVV